MRTETLALVSLIFLSRKKRGQEDRLPEEKPLTFVITKSEKPPQHPVRQELDFQDPSEEKNW